MAARAATYTAASSSETDVAAMIAFASSGDTVIIPPGSSTWTTTLYVDKGVALQGSGTNQTIITANTGGDVLISLVHVAGGVDTISGFQITGTCRAAINISGANGHRVTGMYLNLINGVNLNVSSCFGCIDHNNFTLNQNFGVETSGSGYGDDSWHDAASYGTTNSEYIENNYFNSAQFFAIIDNYTGARFTFRYNNVQDGFIEAHGTDSSQRFRGMRQCEIYNNIFAASVPESNQAIHLRSGSGVIFSNLFVNYQHQAEGVCARYTTAFLEPWGAASGFNPWDSNDVANPYAKMIYSGPGQTNSDSDFSKNTFQFFGIPNTNEFQWLGFTCWNTNNGTISAIGDSTGTTNPVFTFYFVKQTGDLNPVFVANNGDSVWLSKVITCLDQVGNGSGDLLTGDDAINSTTGTPAWPHEPKEMVYFYGNTNIYGGVTNAGAFDALGGYLTIIEGRDFTNGLARPSYTPLVYPHPLDVSTNTPPIPPTLPSVIASPRNARISNLH